MDARVIEFEMEYCQLSERELRLDLKHGEERMLTGMANKVVASFWSGFANGWSVRMMKTVRLRRIFGLGIAFGALLSAAAAIVVAAEPPTVRLRPAPDVRGRDMASAQRLLRAADLTCASGAFPIALPHWKESLDPQRVAFQVPKPGDSVVSGQTIGIWRVVKAPVDAKPAKTPDLRGLTRKQAAVKLKEAGLTLMTTNGVEPAKEGAGRIAAQYPRPDQWVLPETSVFVRLGTTTQ